MKNTETEQDTCYWCQTTISGTGKTKIAAYNKMLDNLDAHEAICIARYRAQRDNK